MTNVSLIIPSYKDPYLHKTVQSALDNFVTDFEIIPVIDGYDLETPLVDDERVKPIFLEQNGGMRNAINQGVKAAQGKYIMRADEHVMFAPRFDEVITALIQDNWIVDAVRYFLDPVKWERMDKPPIVFEKLIISGNHNKFASLPWPERDDAMVDTMLAPTMAMQGSCWTMARSWWDSVIGELQTEGYGPLYQDSTEMQFKTWKAGGELMKNKMTWYAHKHRSFSRTHKYSNKEARKSWDYAREQWEDYYKDVIKPRWTSPYYI